MEKLVLIATFNESESIEPLLSAIHSSQPDAHILVVDDNSPDKTADIVQQFGLKNPQIHLLLRTGKRGYGMAVLDGFRWALEHGAKTIVTLDADFSHDPLEISEFFNALGSDAQMILGSRYKGGVRVLNWELRRLCLSLLANAYARFLLILPFADCTSGYRGYKREVLETLLKYNLRSRGYSFLVELLFWAYRAKYKIVEIPIIFSERRRGQSKMSGSIIFEALLRPFGIWIKYFTSRH